MTDYFTGACYDFFLIPQTTLKKTFYHLRVVEGLKKIVTSPCD